MPIKDINQVRIKMPEQDAKIRVTNFEEVNVGLSEKQAIKEAERCIQCKNPKCIVGCPVSVKIPQFINAITKKEFDKAANILQEDNVLPAVCGRVCPQEEQCEKHCILGIKQSPIAIGYLERFVADWQQTSTNTETMLTSNILNNSNKKIAIVGSGPAGLSCAGDLINMKYEVTIFEALHEYGGVLAYGIPEFRLPKKIVKREIDNLQNKGVTFVKDYVIGMSETIDELLTRFDACFIAVGAGLPYFLNIKGEEFIGVYSANEFLTRINLMKAYKFPLADTPVIDLKDKNVVVFGGGNTAMDSVRTAKRLGAKRAIIMYRRTEAEMPARKEEIHHAKEEDIEFLMLVAPMEFNGNDNGILKSVTIQKMELGTPDESGRRRPIPIPNALETINIDAAIIAIGNGSNPIISQKTPDLKVNKWGNIIINEKTMATNKKGVFAGGDIVTGGATVIMAMGAGRIAAKSINEYLNKN